MTTITRERARELAEKHGWKPMGGDYEFAFDLEEVQAMLTDFHQQVIASLQAKIDRIEEERDTDATDRFDEMADLRAKLAQSEARVRELEKTIKWLDAWLGSRPMSECSARIRAALNKEPGHD